MNELTTKKEISIPSWLKGWHSDYQTCLEVWQELKDKALAHHLSLSQIGEIEDMMEKYAMLHREIAQLEKENRGTPMKLYNEELFPLGEKIREYWKDKGYIDFRIIEDGKVGMRSVEEAIALNPEYDDICFTYDEHEFFYMSFFPVKKNGKWGLVDSKNEVLLPFEYDFIFRMPGSPHYYILIKEGQQGIANYGYGKACINIAVPVEMDAVYYVPGWDLALFTKDGKWGWWWSNDSTFYHNYCQPEYDQIFIQPIQEVWKMEDDDDEVIVARKGDCYYDILYSTIK